MSSVDVIIPCYNYARFLRQCVYSVLTQERVKVRALIIDDASDDHTPQVGRALAHDDRRVEFRRHASNRGHIATYNEGLDWAAADYVLLLSADDGLTPGALSRAAQLMDAHPEVGLTYGRQILCHTDWPPVNNGSESREPSWQIVSGRQFIETVCANAENPVPTPTAVVRTTVHKIAGGYRKELPHSGDLEMWLRIAANAGVAVTDSEQGFKRMHGTNMQIEFVDTGVGDLIQRRAAFESFFREHGGRIAVDRLNAAAHRRLAADAFWAASRAFDRGDVANCDRLLEFASEVYPEVRGRSEWSRLTWKRRLGPDIWGVLRPLIERLRSRRPAVRVV